MPEAMLTRFQFKLRRALTMFRNRTLPARFDLDDVAQESMLQVVRQVGPNGLTTSRLDTGWIQAIAVGQFCKLQRFHLRHKRSVNRESITFPEQNEVSGQSSPADIVEKREQAIRLLAHIDRLGPLEQQVMVLRFFEDKSYNQIADELEISFHSVRKILTNSIRDLQELLLQDRHDYTSA